MIVLDMFVDCFVPFRVPRPLLSSCHCSIILWPLHTVLFINSGTIWHNSTQFYVQGHLRKKIRTDNANEIERYNFNHTVGVLMMQLLTSRPGRWGNFVKSYFFLTTSLRNAYHTIPHFW